MDTAIELRWIENIEQLTPRFVDTKGLWVVCWENEYEREILWFKNEISALSFCEKIKQEPNYTDWSAEDLVEGSLYESIHFGAVKYIGLDYYMGETTHAFKVGRLDRRYWSSSKLNRFLKPKTKDGLEDLIEAAHQAIGSFKALGAESGYASEGLKKALKNMGKLN